MYPMSHSTGLELMSEGAEHIILTLIIKERIMVKVTLMLEIDEQLDTLMPGAWLECTFPRMTDTHQSIETIIR